MPEGLLPTVISVGLETTGFVSAKAGTNSPSEKRDDNDTKVITSNILK